jgi:hypothetical protein
MLVTLLCIFCLHPVDISPLEYECRYEPDARAIEEATSIADVYDPTSLYVLNSDTWGQVVRFMRYFGFSRDTLTIEDVRQK